ncbi:VOC family protein [Geitlerinema splendidum]|nr:VOC family protein [Geitlerinema splendidum]
MRPLNIAFEYNSQVRSATAMRRRANETIYYVKDIDSAIDYYTQNLGFELEQKFDWGFALLKVDDEGGRVGLMSTDLYEREFGSGDHPMPRLAINVANLEAEVTNLAKAGVRVSAIAGESGGNRAAHAYDPDGNAFFLWETGTGDLFNEDSAT